MKNNKLLNNKIYRNIISMLLFGVLSLVFGLLEFKVPGLLGVDIDLREIPLLIGVFYFKNPLFLVGATFITSFDHPASNLFITNFVMHSISIVSVWYLYQILSKQNIKNIVMVLIWFLVVALLYYPLIIGILAVMNPLTGVSVEANIPTFFTTTIMNAWFEIMASALISTLFLSQHLVRQELEISTKNLEIRVKERTEELSRTVEQLKLTKQELIQSEKMSSLKVLTAGIAHEINNPLNFINGAIHMMSDIEDKIQNNDFRKNYKTINSMLISGYERIYKIVRDLTHFTTDSNEAYKNRDLHKIIGMSLLLIRPSIPSGVRVKTNYKLKSMVPIYSEKIHQVILNLIHNAIQATNIKSNKNKLIEISTYETKDNAYIEIFNTGKNIPKNLLNKIFDPFFTTKSPREGTGLGLSICYSIIKTNHEGSINVENVSNGVKFIVELPLSHKSKL